MRIALLCLALLCCKSASAPSTAGPAAVAAPETRVVTVLSSTGQRVPVRVELALDNETRERGLMYRRTLGQDDGMLFVFNKEQVLNFWMKNTLIPLDMIFIRADGTVAGFVSEAAPQTTIPRGVGIPTLYVLEVNGGWCAKNGVRAGDRVLLTDVPSTTK